MKKIKIGVVPTKRSFLSLEAAAEVKSRFMPVISQTKPEQVTLVDIDDLCPQGILFELEHVDAVISKMKQHAVDALFFPFCDFGEERVVAAVAGAFSLPVLVWGERDDRPNTVEQRGRDTQCGLFAATKVLLRMGKVFSYILNEPSSSAAFREGFIRFVRVVSVVRTVGDLRIAQLGMRPQQFMSVVASESGLVSQFGIDTVPIALISLVQSAQQMIQQNNCAWQHTVQDLRSRYDWTRAGADALGKSAAFLLAVKQVLDESGCSAAALACWSELPALFGITPCFVIGELAGQGIPVACEGDLNGAVTSALLQAAAMGDSPVFFADLTIRHPDNDQAELLWHCGPFPSLLKDPACQPVIERQAAGQWQLKPGPITLARFDELKGNFSMTACEGKATEGPETLDTYVWFETDNWPAVEEKFIFGPYIHHVSGAYGHYEAVLREASRYIEGLSWDAVSTGPRSL